MTFPPYLSRVRALKMRARLGAAPYVQYLPSVEVDTECGPLPDTHGFRAVPPVPITLRRLARTSTQIRGRTALRARGARQVGRGARQVGRGARQVGRAARQVGRGARQVGRAARQGGGGAREDREVRDEIGVRLGGRQPPVDTSVIGPSWSIGRRATVGRLTRSVVDGVSP